MWNRKPFEGTLVSIPAFTYKQPTHQQMNVKRLEVKFCICKVEMDWLNANKRVISLVSERFFSGI